jgi:oxygen-independent coproporphyrinogen-3 oxidase
MAGLYIHIPFCSKACHYCDFHFSTDTRYRGEMMSSIIRELELQEELAGGDSPETIYLGGGTPSLLNERELGLLFQSLHRKFDLLPDAEITLEANPDDLSAEKLRLFQSLGINRLSIGVQSFHDQTLNMMNRSHSGSQALQAIATAREAGFRNISLDLIFAVPGRTMDLLQQDLEIVLGQSPEHISCYGLTVEERTVFGKNFRAGQFKPVSEDQNADEFELIMDTLAGTGYRQYEVSNFSIPGFESKHNSSYWHGIPYLGLGPGAHSYFGNERFSNIANNHRYMSAIREGNLPRSKESLSRTDRINEYLMTSLRLDTGLNLDHLKSVLGHEPDVEQLRVINGLISVGSAQMERNCLILTRKGRLVADKIAADLFLTES